MYRHRLFLSCIVLSVLVSLGGLPSRASAVAPTAYFGYTVEKLDGTFIDMTDATQVPLEAVDAISEAINIGFIFKFFENEYTSFRICSNGFITFDADPDFVNCPFTNQRIPVDYYRPNDFIAAFWDSLVLGSGSPAGKVYVKALTGPSRIAIEWKDVNRAGSAEKITFQIVLYVNGNIDLNYVTVGTVTNHNTIGIEDSDGVDGIQVFYNGAGYIGALTDDMSVKFTYPASTEHVKGLPAYQSGFLKDRVAEFQVTAVNNGDNANTYVISREITAGQTGWDVTFLDAVTRSGITQIGPIQPGEDARFIVRVTASAGSTIGEYALVKVNLAGAGGAAFSVTIQTAISSSFVQMFSDVEERINLDVVTQSEQYSKLASNAYDYDKTLAVAHIDPDEYWYLSVWNPNVNSLHYSRTNALFGSPKVQPLTDNTSAPNVTRDEYPAIDVYPNGTGDSGVVFVRTITDNLGKLNINVYLARISKDGVKIGEPLNITNKTEFADTTTPDFPHYQSPRIAALLNGYLLTWVRTYYDSSGNYHYAIDVQAVNLDGTPRGTLLTIPGLISSDEDPVSIKHFGTDNNFLTYFTSDNKLIVTRVNDMGGIIPDIPTTISNVTGKALDMVRLGNFMLIAWINTVNGKINYAFLDSSGALKDSIMEFEPPDGRYNDVVSVTYDFSDLTRAILTWENAEADRLYYAMVDALGAVTPPMIYRQAKGTLPVVHTGAPGASLSPLPYPLPPVYGVNLPVISK